MRKTLTLLLAFLAAGIMCAQQPKGGQPQGSAPQDKAAQAKGQQTRRAQRKFQILVKNVERESIIRSSNEQMQEQQTAAKERAIGAFGNLLWSSYSSSIIQKTVNATSNLVSLGVNYLAESIKGERSQWYKTAKEQCHFNQVLSAESSIDDFYAAPSVKGAMDPENLKFEGFGLKNYIELADEPGQGVNVFYIFCRMRRDSVGISHIVNHSKFLVEIDTLAFIPKYCNLPNDPTGGADVRFSFDKRKDLQLTLKARIYSSWMNQATMITNDEQLGEFTIHVKVDAKMLDSNGQFIYKKGDPAYQRLVSIEGDSYIVPRSYTGTTDALNYQPSWGTGQYRIEMEVSEDCAIVDSYYQIREAGNGEAVAAADATKGKTKWDKAKWKTEWTAMKQRRKGDSVWKNAWNCIVQAYKGTSWVATLTDPAATSLYSYETTKLNEAFSNLRNSWFDETGTAAPVATPGMQQAGAAGQGAKAGGQGGYAGGQGGKAGGQGGKAGGSKPAGGMKQ